MSTPPPPVPPAPFWAHCAHGADLATDPVGCRGGHVPGHTACFAHLTAPDRAAYLASLTPGAPVDHRGTPFTGHLLDQLLDTLRDPTTGHPRFGLANFDGAQFSGDAEFSGAQFSGPARFGGAQFSGPARFDEARFSGYTWFDGAQFSADAAFGRAQFSADASFDRVQFSGDASFGDARFSGYAEFGGAQFSGPARFGRVRFSGDASFGDARFSAEARFYEVQFSDDVVFDGAKFCSGVLFNGAQFGGATSFGPMVCAGRVDLAGAVFGAPATLEIAAREVRCERTRWDSTATIRLRFATVHLSHAVLSAPVAVTAHPTSFETRIGLPVDESLLTGSTEVRVASVQGVDAAHLVLTDTDLTDCLFSGSFHLDQLRLEGRTTFAPTPSGWHHSGVWPVRWTRRRTLAEEHHWRAQTTGQPAPSLGPPALSRQWCPGPHHTDPALTPDPVDVAALYRQLRKAFEDGKNEPGAADFYYGECEMRRHDTTSTPKGERRLLWAYWLLSGYGLRASRATGWLLAAMTITVLLLMTFGLPTHDPDPATTGTLHGSKISLTTTSPDPALHGGWPQRMTGPRAEKATRIAVNSVVFRSSGQNLTTAGTYIEMASRLLEPTLLALAALAVRGRIKR
ncbi:pentapeptide repeat-containing protein [Streptomyces sp. NPDC051554]|uniref:pentapeptide repeat-containing protein n=1 Tax=Streptomyces sp. NPDC051554 TaxID=3365656 RepID=UPI0037B9B63D